MYDVIGVSIKSGAVRLLYKDKLLSEAITIAEIVEKKFGVTTEFFIAAPSGRYKDGDPWILRRGGPIKR